jgi:hypothetical protein
MVVSVLTFDDEHWEADVTLRNRSWSPTPAFWLKTSFSFRLIENYKGHAIKTAVSKAKKHLHLAIGTYNPDGFLVEYT